MTVPEGLAFIVPPVETQSSDLHSASWKISVVPPRARRVHANKAQNRLQEANPSYIIRTLLKRVKSLSSPRSVQNLGGMWRWALISPMPRCLERNRLVLPTLRVRRSASADSRLTATGVCAHPNPSACHPWGSERLVGNRKTAPRPFFAHLRTRVKRQRVFIKSHGAR